jgi:hypothetical protein
MLSSLSSLRSFFSASASARPNTPPQADPAVAASPPFSRTDSVARLAALDVAGVSAWLRDFGVDGADVAAVAAEKVGGASLLNATVSELRGYGVAGAPAKAIVRAIGIARHAPLPPPLVFREEDVGGERMMVALREPRPASGAAVAAAPVFFTPRQVRDLSRFAAGDPLADAPAGAPPTMLLLTGTVKSGKTCMLLEVLPGLLAAQHAAAPRSARRPVMLPFVFPPHVAAEPAARELVLAVRNFAGRVGIELSARSLEGGALCVMAGTVHELAERIAQEGGELWLLLDELQAPLVASTPGGATAFAIRLKELLVTCGPLARVVGTGSGVTLLTTLRALPSNGVNLWNVIKHVRMGDEPSAPAALAMAERIVRAYAAAWTRAAAEAVTPRRVVDALALGTHDGLTSPRPALVAFLAFCVLADPAAAPATLLAAAVDAVVLKLRNESMRDFVTAVGRLTPEQRRRLRELADDVSERPQLAALGAHFSSRDETLAALVGLLCEEGPGPVRLMPPYGVLLRCTVALSGDVSVTVCGGDDESFDESTLSSKRTLPSLKQPSGSTQTAPLGVEC